MDFRNSNHILLFPPRADFKKVQHALLSTGVSAYRCHHFSSLNEVYSHTQEDTADTFIFLHEKFGAEDSEEIMQRVGNLFPNGMVIFLAERESSLHQIEELGIAKSEVVLLSRVGPQLLRQVFKYLLKERELREARKRSQQLQQQLEQYGAYPFALNNTGQDHIMHYSSKEIERVLDKVRHVAPLELDVLINGESGTGKTTLAASIHKMSTRSRRPLIKLDCSAPARPALEVELFGMDNGSKNEKIHRRGKYEMAKGSSLLLEEVGELPMDLQRKLYERIKTNRFEGGGGANVRLIATSGTDLDEAVKEGRFSRELYDRLNMYSITIPPLRERIEDIPVLAEHFVRHFTKKYHRPMPHLSQEYIQGLQAHSWMGNANELAEAVEQMIITSPENPMEQFSTDGYFSDKGHAEEKRVFPSLQQVEHDYILKILHYCDWKINGKNGAAKLLGVPPTQLRTLMKKHEIFQP